MALSQRSLDLDILTLRQVYARGASNSLITSNYALLSDGKGGTYWNIVTLGSNTGDSGSGGGGIAVSTFSSVIGVTFRTLNLIASNINTNTITTSNLTASNINTDTITTSNLTASNINTDTITTSNLTASNIVTNTFTTSNLTASNIVTNTFTTNTLNYESFTFNLQTCNIFINPNFDNADSYPNLISSNLNFYLNASYMNSYLFCTSPSNLNFVPPGVIPPTGSVNSYTGQIQGNFFTLKNMGSNILNVCTNPTTTYPVITSTTATFFYLGAPQNFWTPM